MKLCKVLFLSMIVLVIAEGAYATDSVRIGITSFVSKASGISRNDAAAITDELTRMLTSSYSIAIIDRGSLETIAREHRLNLSGLMDPATAARLGKMAGLQYIITGAITNFTMSESSSSKQDNEFVGAILGSTLGDLVRSKRVEKVEEAEVTIDMRVIDVNTTEVVLAMAETGVAKRTTSGETRGKSTSIHKQDINLQNAAVSDAVSRIGHRIKEKIAGEYPQVLNPGSREIIISIGATSGVKVGNLYKISLEGEEITDMQGNILGKRTTPLAVVEVSEVQNDFSAAKAVGNGGNIALVRRGDRVESISQREFSDLVSKNSFPRRRPGGGSLNDLSLRDDTPSETVRRDEPETIAETYRNPSAKLENISTNSAKVISSYGLSESDANSLKNHHKETERMLSRDEKFNRYTELFKYFPYDYLAAYQAAKIMFDIAHYSEAIEWSEKSLSVNPRYSPAKKLLKAAKANQ